MAQWFEQRHFQNEKNPLKVFLVVAYYIVIRSKIQKIQIFSSLLNRFTSSLGQNALCNSSIILLLDKLLKSL